MFLIIELLFIVLLSMVVLMIYRNERMLSKKVLSRAKIEEYWDGRERRQHVRFRKNLEVTYTVQKRPHLKNGKTVDISEGGLKLLLDEKLAEGAIVDLQIALPDSKKMAEVEGEVVWSSDVQEKDPSSKRLFYSGIRFFAIREPSNTNLIEYIHSLCKGSEP